MRLVDLDPKWVLDREGRRVGVSFLCPLCGKNPAHGISTLDGEPFAAPRERVPFANPLDGATEAFGGNGHRWQRTGEDFETLTLAPSVNAEGCCYTPCPGWHGYIRNGEVT